jgi:hypothetical protein
MYFEFEIPEEIAAKIMEGETLTESGLLAMVNEVCQNENAEVVWEFGGFPRVLLLRRLSEQS